MPYDDELDWLRDDRSLWAVYEWRPLNSGGVGWYRVGFQWDQPEGAKALILGSIAHDPPPFVGWWIYYPPGDLLKKTPPMKWNVWKRGQPPPDFGPVEQPPWKHQIPR